MKTFQIFICSFSFLLLSLSGFAQKNAETIKVPGECGTCKKKIEAAAKKGGASTAAWDADTKMLTVTYANAGSAVKIQQEVAKAGYDTPRFKATDKAYNNLDACCQYERTETAKAACCSDVKCTAEACAREGHQKSDCKEACCARKDEKHS